MFFYSVCIFISAFLVFQVQPLIARKILPWFGGTPTVWSTVMLFFQVLLTGGYAYAYWLIGRQRNDQQGKIHLALLFVSLVLMLVLALLWPSPIIPGQSWKPAGVDMPVLRIFLLLTISVGLPYFILATNSPLMQAWFSRSFPGKSPYWLYALSNVGSLLALLSYPVLIEPFFNLQQQGWFWSLGYMIFAVLAGYGAWRSIRAGKVIEPPVSNPASHSAVDKPSASLHVWWLVLSAVASVLLLSITSQMTQEVAVIPFLWVLPLALYLLTFILAFSGEGRYRRPLFTMLLLCATVGLVYAIASPDTGILVQIVLYSLFLFAACMVAHGELYRMRPDSAYLTRFYLMVSVGGALGGIFVNLVAPYVFSGYWELYIGSAAIWALLAVLTFVRPTMELRQPWRFRHDAVVGSLAVALALFAGFIIFKLGTGDLFRERNFYGIVRVRDDPSGYRALFHGITNHGYQYTDAERRMLPTSYFWDGSGVGLTIRNHPLYGKKPMRVGVLGLGIGVLAAYGQPGDTYRFYEINPLVVDLAEGQNDYFSFLSESPAEVEVILGDARISLEQELLAGQRQDYDVLILDTFSSDAIPVHLTTREAFALYLEHLAPDGIIAAHISNKHIDLRPVIWQMGQAYGFHVVSIVRNKDPRHPESLPSHWMILSRDQDFFDAPEIFEHADKMEGFTADVRLWTDDYSNLFQVLK